MKKLLILCLTAILLCTAIALADGEIYGMMSVVNCNEWVSLREQPDASSSRLAKVPLGAVLYNCIQVSDEFCYAEFGDLRGYIKSAYLEAMITGPLQEEQAGVIPYRELMGSGDVVLRDDRDPEAVLIATMDYSEGECLRVGLYGKDNAPVWGWTTIAHMTTELPGVDVFLGGTAEHPLVLVYNASLGLTALDRRDGHAVWTLKPEQCSLGSGICHAAAADGTLYIAGYYGPDPVCISPAGEVQWCASINNDDVYWPYRIQLKADGIVTCYDSCRDAENSHYEVTFALQDGAVKQIDLCVNHE